MVRVIMCGVTKVGGFLRVLSLYFGDNISLLVIAEGSISTVVDGSVCDLLIVTDTSVKQIKKLRKSKSRDLPFVLLRSADPALALALQEGMFDDAILLKALDLKIILEEIWGKVLLQKAARAEVAHTSRVAE